MRKRIGEYLVDRGILKPSEVEQILAFGRSTGLRFGEAGMELGLLSRDNLVQAFGENYLIDFFHVDPQYFPQNTRDVLPKEAVIRFGALPLGLKTLPGLFKTRKLLNLGLLNPARKEVVEAVTELARTSVGAEFAGVKTYLVLAMDFVPVLEKVYQVSEGTLNELESDAIDPTLKMFLEN